MTRPEPHVGGEQPVSSSRSSLVTRSHLDLRAIFLRLLAHPLEQFLAADPVGKAGMVVGARDPRRAALAAVDDEDVEVEAGQIDRRGQPGRAAADHQAVEGFVIHRQPNAIA